MKSHKQKYYLGGLLLGLGVFLGGIVIQVLSRRIFHVEWSLQELSTYSLIYAYDLIFVPLVLAAVGYYLGRLVDQAFSEQKSLEQLNRVLELHSSSLKEMNETLKTQAEIDPITGLYNRQYLLLEMKKAIQSRTRNPLIRPLLYTLMVDVDDFKKINDQYGHLVGDFILKEIADMLKKSVRGYDVVGRYGGDEFIILMPDSSQESAELVAQRIQTKCQERQFFLGGHNHTVTLSIGLASSEYNGESDFLNMIEEADQRLLAAKKSGKNRISAA